LNPLSPVSAELAQTVYFTGAKTAKMQLGEAGQFTGAGNARPRGSAECVNNLLRLHLRKMVGPEGLEPSTNRL
jgi:hypothetical protein